MSRGGPLAAEDVAQLLAAGQSEQLAFLPASASPARLAETLVALANAHGGWVLIGVSASGRLTGTEDEALGDAALRGAVQSAALLASPPLILPPARVVTVEGKRVGVAEVPPGLPHAYSLNGRYLTRSAAANRLLSPSELTGLLLSRDVAGFEARPAPGAALRDLDPGAVEAYVESLPDATGESWERTLAARGCLVEGEGGLTPTYAGALLFGRNPQRFLRNARITLIRYPGPTMGDEFARDEAAGPLPAQIRRAEAFLSANMRRGMRIRGMERQEVAEYPLPVVREAIVNAVAHRDYSIRGDDARVLMFSDRMEIYSPGRLPGHVTLDNLLTERFSRNEAIVQALSDMGFVERLGYGIDRMMAAMRDAGLPEPTFEETVAGFRVTLRGRGEELASREAAPRWGNRRLDPRQERALAYLAERGTITNREFRELIPELSDETVRRLLADLVDQGFIIKIGERKATYYILK
jgi:ATP-dependent DNA helicase RecG